MTDLLVDSSYMEGDCKALYMTADTLRCRFLGRLCDHDPLAVKYLDILARERTSGTVNCFVAAYP